MKGKEKGEDNEKEVNRGGRKEGGKVRTGKKGFATDCREEKSPRSEEIRRKERRGPRNRNKLIPAAA